MSTAIARPPILSVCPKVLLCLLSITAILAGCEKFALDRQMEELCKKDGGVRVYERVVLTESMFDQWGDPFPGWRGRARELRLGAEYRYLVETTYLKTGDPLKGEGRLDQTTQRIVRIADGRLMGDAISYGRSGGDYLAFSHPTSKSCPSGQSESDLVRGVFVRS